MSKKTILIFSLIIYLIVAFVTEIFYREDLYEISLKYIKEIKQKGFFHYFYFFWSYIFLSGMIGVGLYITLVFYPIHIFVTFFSLFIFIISIMCLLKSLYSNSRPYWDIYLLDQGNRTDKFLEDPTECDGEFGNPSGHALLSTLIIYLWNLFINSNYFNKINDKKKIYLKYLTLILSFICIIFMIYSRVNRQVHSFNQIIFGTILGLAVIFALCYILEINKIDILVFMQNLDKVKYIIIPIILLLFGVSVALGLTRHNENEDKYIFILELYCGYIRDQCFGKNTTFHSSIMFQLIGMYIGMLLLHNKIEKNYPEKRNKFYNWNTGSKYNTLKIALCSFLLPFIIPLLMYLIPYKYYYLKFIAATISFLLYGFFSLGFCFYYSCVFFLREEFENNKTLLVNENVSNANQDEANI